jgi:hypothetical protein
MLPPGKNEYVALARQAPVQGIVLACLERGRGKANKIRRRHPKLRRKLVASESSLGYEMPGLIEEVSLSGLRVSAMQTRLHRPEEQDYHS